ncbi:MAG: TolC family protein [Alistipes sp.]|nr:TolC family protein [Alistipes sp.]
MRKIILIIFASLIHSAAGAQITLSDYCNMVIEHSIPLQQAELNTERTEAEWQRAKRGQLPQLSMGSQATLDFAHHIKGRRWGWTTNADIRQNIYSGGKISATTRRTELGHEISILEQQVLIRQVILSAESAYWRLSQAEEYRKTMSEYVAIIESLREVIAYRYEEGYSAKGDLLQIESRLSDAHYQLSAAEEAYEIALHNFNSLYNNKITQAISLSESILDSTPKPERVDADTLVWSHPDYRIAELNAERAHADVKLARAPFLPQIDISIYGSLQPELPHTAKSKPQLGGGAVFNFSTPIYHFGERREAMNAAKSTQLSSELEVVNVADNLRLVEHDGWTNIERTWQRVVAAQESMTIAEENLEISTFAYNEGQTTILDVLQAQISWLQTYRNMLAAHYDYQMAVAEYRYIVGDNFMESSDNIAN